MVIAITKDVSEHYERMLMSESVGRDIKRTLSCQCNVRLSGSLSAESMASERVCWWLIYYVLLGYSWMECGCFVLFSACLGIAFLSYCDIADVSKYLKHWHRFNGHHYASVGSLVRHLRCTVTTTLRFPQHALLPCPASCTLYPGATPHLNQTERLQKGGGSWFTTLQGVVAFWVRVRVP